MGEKTVQLCSSDTPTSKQSLRRLSDPASSPLSLFNVVSGVIVNRAEANFAKSQLASTISSHVRCNRRYLKGVGYEEFVNDVHTKSTVLTLSEVRQLLKASTICRAWKLRFVARFCCKLNFFFMNFFFPIMNHHTITQIYQKLPN